MRFAILATSCALLAACFSKPGFTPSGDGDAGIDASIDAPSDGPPIDPSAAALIATGGEHACRILAGSLLCWGSNDSKQQGERIDVPDFSGIPGAISGYTDWTTVAAGARHACGVRMGTVYCWGENAFGQSSPPSSTSTDLGVTAVALPDSETAARVFASGTTTCALSTTRKAYCWGTLDFGTSNSPPMTPQRLGTATATFKHIALADDHGCALAEDGQAHCWGVAEQRQTGRVSIIDVPYASAGPIDSPERFTSLASGHEASCGTTTTGQLMCWGSSNQGQLGNLPTPDPNNGYLPRIIDASTKWTSVAIGALHTCAVGDGNVFCWGDDQAGALGSGTFDSKRTMSPMVALNMQVSQIAASSGFTCALSTDGSTMKCWGNNGKGEIGNGEASRRYDPLEVTFPQPSQPAHQIVAGNNHSCALIGMALPAPAFCWGLNRDRQIGSTSSQVLHAEPVRVGNYLFTQIAAGGLHTCGITSDDSVIACWGDNVSHQLGPTNNANMDTVSALPSGARWTSVAAGSRMSCGITNANRLYCWGLRAGQMNASMMPVEYPAPTGIWKSISIGSDFAVGVIESLGQPRMFSISLPDPEKLCAANLPSNQTTPEMPTEILSGMIPSSMRLPTVAAAQHSGEHTCLLRYASASGPPIMTCFGTATYGRTAGATTCDLTPNTVTVTSPLSGVDWAAPTGLNQTLFTASDHSCALATSGALICWGLNGNFELGRMFPGATPLVIGTKTWASIDGGFDHTCGIDGNRKVFCWGENQYGQVGDGSSYEPSPVVSGVP